ncbi:ATPase [Paraliobacillus quinghaiensis]|uniref:ATPase n=1 Tax=Paraliobacillus quinghaiensis TaxID=470815 RepID=A0A917TDU5_9BACI|nr:MoxR family ATPase [Paraliobacillus quinghaiensis]GGM19837.1 ATPase [Paraliobacillus quinghaiensis]
MEISAIQTMAAELKSNVNNVIVGKSEVVDQLLVALIASGHVLLEDVPGTGKTLLAKSLATSLSCSFNRVQFTPDLLPSDVTGLSIYRTQTGEFEFQPGPVFTNILLADEINRATPRTQSSLLESMEERQVTIDGTTRQLEQPFMVIATQNPIESQGTFPLPEAQLDRFFLKIKMGYPSTEEGIEILRRFKQTNPLTNLDAVIDKGLLIKAQDVFTAVYVSEELLAYVVGIVEESRNHKDVLIGVSPRGSQALLRAIQAYAAINGRDYVQPDDVKAMAASVLSHRLVLKPMASRVNNGADTVINDLLNTVTVPTEAVLSERLQ